MNFVITIVSLTQGSAYIPDNPPTIDIWDEGTGTQMVTSAFTSRVGTTNFYSYTFTTGVYGRGYVYRTSSDAFLADSERYQYGQFIQDTLDRVFGTVQASGSNGPTQFKTQQAETATGHWNNAICQMMTGALTGQVRKITSYEGTTKIIGMTDGFTSTPTVGDTYQIINL